MNINIFVKISLWHKRFRDICLDKDNQEENIGVIYDKYSTKSRIAI